MKLGPAILPVIHYADDNQAMRNAERALEAGCDGVLLIDMTGRNTGLSFAARAVKRRWPAARAGVNWLGLDPWRALLGNRDAGLDWTWTDEQLTHTGGALALEACRVDRLLRTAQPHALFCAVAFKHQPGEPDAAGAALRALRHGFIPTTSGPATGVAADPSVIAGLREEIGPEAPLAIASGITPENAAAFLPHVTHVLVSTGVSASFYEFDPVRLRALVDVRR